VPPTCVPRACPILITPGNGAALFGLTGVTGDVVSFACNAGYTLTGAASLTCLTTSAWSAATPTCPAAPCVTLVAPGNGTVSSTVGTTGTQRSVACNAGYTLSGANVTTCQASGAWTTVSSCTPRNCSALASPTNGAVSPAAGYTGVLALYTCNQGYSLTGANRTICQTNSTWSAVAPTCTAKPCPTLVAPRNGAVSGTTGTTGTVRFYSCNFNFVLTGSASTACLTTGNWSATAPTCA